MWRRIVGQMNALVVVVYKVVGLGALGAILLGLLGYFALQGFFLLNHSWVAPTVLSPTDERILQLNTQIAQQTAARERLLAEKRDLRVRIDDATRQAMAQDRFLGRFRDAVATDHASQARHLQRLLALREQHQGVRDEIRAAEEAFAGLTRTRADQLRQANLLDRERYLTTHHQLAQMTQLNLALAESGVELEGRTTALLREVRGLETLLRGFAGEPGRAAGHTTATLLLEQQYARARLERELALETGAAAKESMAALDVALARYDQLLASLRGSPYLKAMERDLNIAFVPYENLPQVQPGVVLYGCALRMLWCRRVGSVAAVLDGEVTIKHPIRTLHLRGVMVELALEDNRWAHEQLLHAGHPPFLL